MKYRLKQNFATDRSNSPRHFEGQWPVAIQRAQSALVGALDCHGAVRLAMTRWGESAGRVISALILAVLPIVPAQADIAQGPLDSTVSGIPVNMMLVLSVEHPTGRSRGYGGLNDYSNANRYIGYFDPEGCYSYHHDFNGLPNNLAVLVEVNADNARNGTAGTNIVPGRNGDKVKDEYFVRTSKTSDRKCDGETYSGNFMNWATMQTLDEFRFIMTGGDRIVDTEGMTIIQNTRFSGNLADSAYYYVKEIHGDLAHESVPYGWDDVYIRLSTPDGNGLNPFGTDETAGRIIQFSNNKNFSKPSCSDSSCSSMENSDGNVMVYMGQVKVCDPNTPPDSGLEYNGEGDYKLCEAYPNNGGTPIYKPVGLMQKYADKVRFGAVSYLLDGNSNRAGGVIRSRLKSVGKKQLGHTVGGADNPNMEWDPQTGIHVENPDTADASASGVSQSGIINYLNRFGKVNNYKISGDPVSELFYTALLAVRNVGLPGHFYNGATSAMKDGFPVIVKSATDENDAQKRPIQHACQKTHFVGIADPNTWYDTYAPGSTLTGGGTNHTWDNFESTANGLDVKTLTDKIGELENKTLPDALSSPNRLPLGSYLGVIGSCATCKSGTYFVGGLAYWANTQDMLPDNLQKSWTIGKQQAKTHFISLERSFVATCGDRDFSPTQLYMAAKYGGFDHQNKPESEYETLLSEANRTTSWDKNDDCVPDNYFLGTQPEMMASALKEIAETVAADADGTRTTGAMAASSIALETDTQLYQSSYDPADWSGNLKGYGFCTINKIGKATGCTAATIGQPLMTSSGEPLTSTEAGGWVANFPTHTARKVYTRTQTGTTWSRADFKDDQSSVYPLSTLATDDTLRKNIINYLRGDMTHDGHAFRQRNGKLLGDIVNSGAAYAEPGAQDHGWSYATNPLIDAAQKIAYRERRATALMSGSSKKTVFIGANDGMLHAFEADPESASSGYERFAYIPYATYEHLAKLTQPNYQHRYFVDGTPVAGDYWNGSEWRTLLVTSTGAGGRSYFALDVEDPNNPKVQWEISGGGDDAAAWPPLEAAFTNLGVAIGKASIVPTNDKSHPWVVIFGNGYESRGTNLDPNVEPDVETNTSHRARLFIVDAETGALVKQISTGEGSASLENGLSTPLVVDYDGNGSADAAYAGDLQGNLWKFDLQGDVSNWELAFNQKPLLKATDPDGNPQPITAQPEAMRRKGHPGEVMVYVGSGKWMETGDPSDKRVQTLYGVSDPCGSIGSCSLADSYTRDNLLEQTLSATTVPDTAQYGTHANEAIRTISANAPEAGKTDNGFYVDLIVGDDTQGERVIANAKIYYDRVRFYSLVPINSGDLCEGVSTEGWIYEFDPWTGATLDYAFGNAYGDLAAGIRVSGSSGRKGVSISNREFIAPDTSTLDKSRLRYGRRSWRQFR
jgi:type IV pilus assembly protein PilY1